MSDFDFTDALQRLADADRPTADHVARGRRRLRDALAQRKRQTRRMWWATAAVAAAALVVWWLTPAGVRDVPLDAGPVALTHAVQVTATGEGRAEVEGDTTTVHWSRGHLRVSVDPDAGQVVRVRTPDADIRVLGTVFSVDHGPFGTVVSVTRGRVEVACDVGAPHEVTVGGEGWCFRDSGMGLGRVLWMEQQGADAAARLSVIQRALDHPVNLEATQEVLVRREVEAMVTLGRTVEAVVASGGLPSEARRALLSTHAEAALDRGGCLDADPWLGGLVDLGSVPAGLIRVQCLADADPKAARDILDALEPLANTPDDRDALAAWRQALTP